MNNKQVQKNLLTLVTTAMFAAMITLTTAYLFHIPVGTAGGYIHLGDAFIYLAACFLPMPYAVAGSAVGAALADALSPGGMVWVIPTLIIKSLMVLPFTSRPAKILPLRNILACVVSGVICMGGYYVAEGIMTGNWISPLATLWAGFIQSGGSAAVFLVIGFALDRAGLKQRLNSRLAG